MKGQCSFIPKSVWIREIDNGMRHVTLRRSFTQNNKADTEGNTFDNYDYEETNIYIVDRDNIEDYINSNFDILFEQGLINEKKLSEPTTDERIFSLEKAMNDLLMGGI